MSLWLLLGLSAGLLGTDAPETPVASHDTALAAPRTWVARAGAMVRFVATDGETTSLTIPETAAGERIALREEILIVTYTADFDLDGDVDRGDLQLFLLFYGLPAADAGIRGDASRYDIDRSGQVDDADLSILRRYYGVPAVPIPDGSILPEEIRSFSLTPAPIAP